MKKIYVAIITTAIMSGLYMINKPNKATINFLGDATTIGPDEDGQTAYEVNMLRDPATGKIPAHISDKELAFAATLPNDMHSSFLSKTTTVSWQQRGPWNVGGRTRAFGIDATNENILIAGSVSGGMWRSTDQGASWTATSTSLQHKSVTCLAQDTRTGHTSTWYYGTGEAYGASAGATGAYYLGNGIYKSTDGGLTWNVLAATSTGSLVVYDIWADLVWNIAVNPAVTSQDVVYAAAVGGLYKTLDGGTSWTLAKGSTNSYFTDVAVSPTGVIYATFSSDGASKGIYRSTDGTTFTNITPAGFPATYNRLKIGICPQDETQIYILGNTPGFGQPDTNFVGDVEWNSLWKYKFLSGDGSGAGGQWNDYSLNLPTTGGLFDKFTCQGSYDLVVKVKPNDSNTVFIGGTNLYRSTSGFKDAVNTTFIGGYQQGATLPVVNLYANHHPDQHDIAFFPSDPNKMISVNDGGIFKTTNNMAPLVSWNSLNNGYLTSLFYTCAIDHATTNDIIIGGAQDNGSWYTNATTLTTPWVTPRGGDGSYCAIADNGLAYYFSIQNGKVMKAKLNAAGAVDSFARIDPMGGKGYLFINPFVLDPNNNNIMYLAGGNYLWRNNDLSGIPYASNWDSISTNWTRFPDSLATGIQITAIAVSKTPANRVYFGTSARKVYRIDGANTGTPLKVDITSTTTGAFFPSGANVSCIAVDPNNGDHIMVVFSNYGVYSLYYSEDGGTTWSKVGGNLENNLNGTGDGPSCRWASIIPVADGTVYLVGTSTGLYATNQLAGAGTYWIQQGTSNIGSSVVDMIDYRATDGLVVVATHSHGIFSSHITSTGEINWVKGVEKSQNLSVYPVPFSSQATIQFYLKNAGQVHVAITDVLGKEVLTVADGQMSAGKKTLSLQGNNLSGGIYYCTIRSAEGTETKEIVLMK